MHQNQQQQAAAAAQQQQQARARQPPRSHAPRVAQGGPRTRPQPQQPMMQQRYVPQQPVWDPKDLLQPGESFGKVRKVISGSTVLVEMIGQAQTSATDREFKKIAIMDIIAPTVSRNESDVSEQLFAWESREFLRKNLIENIVIINFADPERA